PTTPSPASPPFPYTTLFRSLRLTDRDRGRVVIALIGVNRGPEGHWATLGLASDEVALSHEAGGSRRAGDVRTASSSTFSSLRLADRKSTRLNSSHVSISYAV